MSRGALKPERSKHVKWLAVQWEMFGYHKEKDQSLLVWCLLLSLSMHSHHLLVSISLNFSLISVLYLSIWFYICIPQSICASPHWLPTPPLTPLFATAASVPHPTLSRSISFPSSRALLPCLHSALHSPALSPWESLENLLFYLCLLQDNRHQSQKKDHILEKYFICNTVTEKCEQSMNQKQIPFDIITQ